MTVSVIVGRAEVRLIVWTPAPEMLNTIVSAPAAALAAITASRRLVTPSPALITSLTVVTVKVANAWSHCACVASPTTIEASIVPVDASSTQSPYSVMLPVRSVLAATSAPVRAANVFMASWPSAPRPKLQP